MSKTLPFSKTQLQPILNQYPTPFYIYDERGIRNTARQLNQAFSWAKDYKNFYAVKALPNPVIMRLLKSEGMGFDAASLAELELAVKAGADGRDIMFTSNNTPVDEYKRALELGAYLNLDDIGNVDYLLNNNLPLPELVSFRYNPGPGRSNKGNAIIGQPEEAKFGVTRKQLLPAYKLAKEKGARRFGLHTMVVSNELGVDALLETARMVFELVNELNQKLGITLEYVNLGGGLGIPYMPDEKPVDLLALSAKIEDLYNSMIINRGLPAPRIVMENGRYVTGPHGYLITKARHLKSTYKEYVGLDASMADLMRPGMYGAYHEITVLGKEKQQPVQAYDLVGSLCENNDKFAINRKLPIIVENDIVVIHDAGAHAHAMGFNYNGQLRPAEVLLKEDGSTELIRRAETLADYFATLDL